MKCIKSLDNCFQEGQILFAIFVLWGILRKRLRAKLLGSERHIAWKSHPVFTRKQGRGYSIMFLYYHRRSLFQIGNDTNNLTVLFVLYHKQWRNHQTYNNITLSLHICGDAKNRPDFWTAAIFIFTFVTIPNLVTSYTHRFLVISERLMFSAEENHTGTWI